jgi:hypothetical protein
LNGLAPAASASNCRPRIPIRVASVEALRLLREGIHRLLYLPFVRLMQDGAKDLLDSHGHLPSYPLLLVGGSIPPGRRRIVAVPAGSVPQRVHQNLV